MDLSNEHANDFRIWWNLAKPIDYRCKEVIPGCMKYEIKDMYFQKALDAATIEDKANLVKEHDEYTNLKNSKKAFYKK